MQTFETLLLLLVAALALTVIARRLAVPPAVMLVLGGMMLAFVPGLRPIPLEPELALALFLPPLLQASALRTDWNLFRSNIVFIILMAVGAVLFTAAVVALVAHLAIPGLGWPAAIALGAIVAPPDAVAATAVLKRFRLPRRIVTVLEGESLVNDASGLVLYRVAIGAAAAGAIHVTGIAATFALTMVVGVAIGLAVGAGVNWLMPRLNDRFLEIAASFLAAFISYMIAEWVDGSGVLAAVACGGLIGRAQLRLTAQTRLHAASAWELVEFILASLVFLLVGLQLRGIVIRLVAYDGWQLTRLGLLVSGVLIVARFVWVFATFYPASAIVAVWRGETFTPPLSYPTIISWAGMRGVVSLAAALALPAAFQGRDLIVFLSFCAILSTLVLQGTTLRYVIGRFDVNDPGIEEVNEATVAARRVVAAAIAGSVPSIAPVDGDLVDRFERQQRALAAAPAPLDPDRDMLVPMLTDKLAAIRAARLELRARRDELDGETLMTLTRALDLEEEQIRLALHGPGEDGAIA